MDQTEVPAKGQRASGGPWGPYGGHGAPWRPMGPMGSMGPMRPLGPKGYICKLPINRLNGGVMLTRCKGYI